MLLLVKLKIIFLGKCIRFSYVFCLVVMVFVVKLFVSLRFFLLRNLGKDWYLMCFLRLIFYILLRIELEIYIGFFSWRRNI